MTPTTTATIRRRQIEACPTVPADEVDGVAQRAQMDAVQLASDVRDLDPREIWGRLHVWHGRDPIRLYALVVALAAMVPVEESVSRLLAWTDHLEVA